MKIKLKKLSEGEVFNYKNSTFVKTNITDGKNLFLCISMKTDIFPNFYCGFTGNIQVKPITLSIHKGQEKNTFNIGIHGNSCLMGFPIQNKITFKDKKEINRRKMQKTWDKCFDILRKTYTTSKEIMIPNNE